MDEAIVLVRYHIVLSVFGPPISRDHYFDDVYAAAEGQELSYKQVILMQK